MRAPGHREIFSSGDLRKKFTSVLEGWKRRFPGEYAGHVEAVAERRRLIGSGKSHHQHLVAMIPPRVQYVLTAPEARFLTGLPENWQDIEKYYHTFLDCCVKWCFSQKSRPKLPEVHEQEEEIEDDKQKDIVQGLLDVARVEAAEHRSQHNRQGLGGAPRKDS